MAREDLRCSQEEVVQKEEGVFLGNKKKEIVDVVCWRLVRS